MSHPRPPSLRRRLTLALSAVGLSVALLPAVAMAHDGHSHDAEEQSTACPPGLAKRLQEAGDRFGQGCAIPGGPTAQLDDSDTTLESGETASSRNLDLIANLPKRGAFAPESAYNSDLAFSGDYAYAGNYEGFTVYSIKHPKKPVEVAQVVCPGSQNDVSVYGDILVLSVDSGRSNDSCANEPLSARDPASWEGIRVWDISDPAAPQYVAAVETACGSHTHTLAPSKDGANLYVYVSSYGPSATYPDCQPPHDKISVVKVPVDAPETASLASTPVLFPDGGNPGGNGSSTTSGCHDITAYPERDIAAGACMGDGILMDISDRENPVVTETVRDTTNFAFWHSATFNNDGTKVVFTDELGGGGAPTCNPTVGATKGANGIYDIVGGQLEFRSYYKMPRTQANTENCVAHNGSLIPVKGRDVMVQAWYQGGISVFDFTDSANPTELAWFDRGALSDEKLVLGGAWSAYWYNGNIFANDIQKGLDVLDLNDPRTNVAKRVKMNEFNPQSQPSYNG
ncbi:LVIVD repeat-containing protein [Nocardioides sp. LHG3406-4]|uniref:LVIVD repeat-containing protein n=1 Tax=Nocardioides sp. LHG3406-4 TaxID=2804575 RepID=UPI003CEF8DCD